MREIQERIAKLEKSIKILEDHLKNHGHLLEPEVYDYVKKQIKSYKDELHIRKKRPI